MKSTAHARLEPSTSAANDCRLGALTGHCWLALAIGIGAFVTGCGEGESGAARKTGETIGKQLTEFATGVGKGIDQKMLVEVTLAPEVQALGLTNTIAKSLGLDTMSKGISIYLIASEPVSTTLLAKAVNSDGVEIGRSRAEVEFQRNDARYVNFTFESEMDSAMVKRYEISLPTR